MKLIMTKRITTLFTEYHHAPSGQMTDAMSSTHQVRPYPFALKYERTELNAQGTSGTPKGVDVTHQNVTNLICQSPGDLGIKPGTRVGQVLSISFDMGKLRPTDHPSLGLTYMKLYKRHGKCLAVL